MGAVIMYVLAAYGFVLGSLNAYQAITGRRVSKRPSRRSDEQMRRQSSIAAVAMFAATALAVFVASQQ